MYSYGDTPTLDDCCLVAQVVNGPVVHVGVAPLAVVADEVVVDAPEHRPEALLGPILGGAATGLAYQYIFIESDQQKEEVVSVSLQQELAKI